jgi:small multidrug resistance pump
MLSWFLLIIAIFCEATGTVMMKLSQGFTKPLPSVLMFVFYGLGFIPLNLALRRIEVSVAYALWSGLGTLFITLVGIFYFRESVSAVKVLSIFLIIAGVIGLEISAGR